MVATRKRVAEAEQADDAAHESQPKRSRVAGSPRGRALLGSKPQAAAAVPSPSPAGARRLSASMPKKGSRGDAYLSAAGIALASPSRATAASPPRLSTKKASAAMAASVAAEQAAAPPSVLPSARAKRNPLLQQALPAKLSALLDMFAGMQTVYEMMRKRGQRTTFQNMRAAVEEASGRRFLLTHMGQLKHLLSEAIDLEWIRLPVAAQRSRTEPHLLISLDMGAAAEAAAAAGAAPPTSGAGGELQAARQLLQCRLAGHLLDSYRGELDARAAELRGAGDEEAAEQVAEARAAAEEPPVSRFMPPYPEGVNDVPQQALPPRPEAPTPASRGGSPAVLGATAAKQGQAAAATPATWLQPATTATTGRKGRPPVHPNTVDRRGQRRLSFSAVTAAAASRAAGTPLDKLSQHLSSGRGLQGSSAATEQQQQKAEGDTTAAAAPTAAATAGNDVPQLQLHPRQAELAAGLADADLADLHFDSSFSLPTEAEAARERQQAEEARLLACMPQELRRYSTDGIISMDTLRMLEAADQQHRRLSSKEALAAREESAAVGQLPRTFTRLQRIFGFQGPNALKLREVVQRIKTGGGELLSEAQIEHQLRALAQHAPEYLTLKPYGSCGTPAVWVNRRANPNELMRRLRTVAEARRDSFGACA